MTVYRVSHNVLWTVAGHGLTLPSVLSWKSEDPLAVGIAFGEDGYTVKWVIARDLLADVSSGRLTEAGDGDVHVSRSTGDVLCLTLSTVHVVSLQARLDEIKFFLEGTFCYSPYGKEVMDIDTAILRLLDDGQATGV